MGKFLKKINEFLLIYGKRVSQQFQKMLAHSVNVISSFSAHVTVPGSSPRSSVH